MKEKIYLGIIGVLVILLGGAVYKIFLLQKQPQELLLGGKSDFNNPCIYNATDFTLQDGTGSALKCDSKGQLVIKFGN